MRKYSNLLLIGILVIASLLRLWQLDRVSVSLFGDELDVGYHAYSILKTGRDYSGNFLPIHFQSLAEWRTPLYLYSVVPTVALFGVSPWGVKLPAAIFGILGVWVFYLFIRQITGKQGIALLCALVLALSPWHVQYSRAGFEVTQLLTLYIAGIYFFLRGLKNGKWLFPSAVFLALTPWAYSTAKLFLPLTFAALVLIWRRDLLKLPRKQLIIAALCFAIVAAPIAFSTVFGGGAQRFNYISIFSDPTMSPEIGFARLRFPSQQLRKEITKSSALIRELHVFGPSVSIGKKGTIQHKGIGKKLLNKAEAIANKYNKNKLVVISGIGARNYYRKVGYEREGHYMVKRM